MTDFLQQKDKGVTIDVSRPFFFRNKGFSSPKAIND